jgi:SAM-dependent methyltransferase
LSEPRVLAEAVPQELPAAELDRIREARRNPRPTQFDYLHLRILRDDIARELAALEPKLDVLDVWCGTRPYEELLPAGSRCTGLDIDRRYGAADVVSTEFLPFDDDAFDLVVSFEAFHYAPDPASAVIEIGRVLRPGGRVLLTVPLVWEYERDQLEHRFTGPQLASLFDDRWEDVRVLENGGRGIAWATQTGHLISLLEVAQRGKPVATVLRPLFALAYLFVNVLGAAAERASRALSPGTTLPVNLLVTARKIG